MTAMTDAAGTDRHQRAHSVVLPDHLVVWPDGEPGLDRPHQVLAVARSETFSLSALVDQIHGDHPEAVVAVVYPSSTGSPADGRPSERHWIALCAAAAGADGPAERRVFTGDTTPTSLRALRRWVASQVAGEVVDDLVLATSELATNVERHARGWLTVDLIEVSGSVVVGVTDPAVDRLPMPRDVGPQEIGGRGLRVVSTVSSHWGVVVRPASKTVWASLPS